MELFNTINIDNNNMLNLFDKLKEYELEKRVNIKPHESKDLHIVKYTKEQFFKHPWNDFLINNCRGHVYRSDGTIVSMPMPKVFNINEYIYSSIDVVNLLLQQYKPEEIELIEKLNGHLCILFHDGEEWINTTSGTFDGDFVPLDRKVLEDTGFIEFLNNNVDQFQGYTFCFEVIASYDQHLMFSQTIERTDGKDTVFLLYAYHPDKGDISYDDLMIISQKSNILVPRKFTLPKYDIMDLLNHENIEGYILRFPNNLRVKFKTTWYLENRARAGFSGKKIEDVFVDIGDSEEAYKILPEEYHLMYAEIIAEFNRFRNALFEECENLVKLAKFVVAHDDNIQDKNIFKYINDKVDDTMIKQVAFDCLRNTNKSLKAIQKCYIKEYKEMFEVKR